MKSRALRWVVMWGGVGLVWVTAQPTSSVDDDVVLLPTVTVDEKRDAPPPEEWLYAEVPSLEILSSGSAFDTQRFLRDFLLLRSVIDAVMPGLQGGAASEPGVVILCDREGDFRRFLPADQAAEVYRVNQLFFNEGSRSAMVINIGMPAIEIDGSGLGPAPGVPFPTLAPSDGGDEGEDPELAVDQALTLEVDAFRTFRQGYFRHLFRNKTGAVRVPWLEEGLVQVLGSIDFNKRSITIGRIGDGFGGPRTGDFGELLRNRGLMPMDAFFAEDDATPSAIWSAQAYAFTHMCLYGRGKRYQEAFGRLAQAAMRAPVSNAEIETFFGMNLYALGRELRGYIEFTDHRYERFAAAKGESLPEPVPVGLRAAADAESGRVVGTVLALAGKDEEARRVMLAPITRQAEDARLLATFGAFEQEGGNTANAQRFLMAAVAAKVDRADAYLRVAAAQMAVLTTHSETAFSLNRLAPTIAVLESACRYAPPTARVYAALASVWLRCEDSPPRGALGLVNDGVMRFPHDATLLLRAAELNVRFGTAEDARELIAFGRRTLKSSASALAALEALDQRLAADPRQSVGRSPIGP